MRGSFVQAMALAKAVKTTSLDLSSVCDSDEFLNLNCRGPFVTAQFEGLVLSFLFFWCFNRVVDGWALAP